MLIGRLRAYGVKWSDWVSASRYRTRPNQIGPKHRDKRILTQGPDRDYAIHDAIINKAVELGLMATHD